MKLNLVTNFSTAVAAIVAINQLPRAERIPALAAIVTHHMISGELGFAADLAALYGKINQGDDLLYEVTVRRISVRERVFRVRASGEDHAAYIATEKAGNAYFDSGDEVDVDYVVGDIEIVH
jgi:hypothetical protein